MSEISVRLEPSVEMIESLVVECLGVGVSKTLRGALIGG